VHITTLLQLRRLNAPHTMQVTAPAG